MAQPNGLLWDIVSERGRKDADPRRIAGTPRDGRGLGDGPDHTLLGLHTHAVPTLQHSPLSDECNMPLATTGNSDTGVSPPDLCHAGPASGVHLADTDANTGAGVLLDGQMIPTSELGAPREVTNARTDTTEGE